MGLWDIITGADQERDRNAAIRNFAYNAGMVYSESAAIGMLKQLQAFELFKQGTQRKIKNLIIDREMDPEHFMFDYDYTISTGKSSHTYSQSVQFFDSKALSLPQFRLKPENFFDVLIEWFGFKDIDFNTHPEFSKEFKLTGEFESVIRYYFDSDILNLIEQQKEFNMEGMNFYLVIHTQHKVLPVQQLDGFKKFGTMLFELFKLRSQKSLEEFEI
ncbi:MAG: hypothetical protein IPP06_15945 [Saprospiraceae bacterium]|nr:hypothetical protein [Candidatus Vicinibacter affinis]MBP6523225.1 hypothetical protein [Saprospiraceae bacterium]MBK6824251.1 hypothetical protein [Candidatus Vicinibacter affinis]MBK7303867.1 hypothetical protein [Candidatus Vicinibacter affinis]MBK7694348.1 hypothetical protein [Candidatus Vicinibacter affinis]